MKNQTAGRQRYREFTQIQNLNGNHISTDLNLNCIEVHVSGNWQAKDTSTIPTDMYLNFEFEVHVGGN